MPALFEPEARERLRLVCALLFWAMTYLLFLAWNQLQDEFPSALWQTRRGITTMVGAGLFYGFTALADRIAGRSHGPRVLILLGGGILCCLAMAFGRAAVDTVIIPILGEQTSTWDRHFRFAIIWGGYFAGGVIAFLGFVPLQTSTVIPPIEPAPVVEAPAEALWVSRGRESVRVPIDAIDWIEAEGDYVRLHARTGGGLMRGTLSGLEERLDSRLFARVHRSAICRRSAIVAMLRKPSGALAVRLDNGAEVPVGRRYRDSVAELLGLGKTARERLSA